MLVKLPFTAVLCALFACWTAIVILVIVTLAWALRPGARAGASLATPIVAVPSATPVASPRPAGVPASAREIREAITIGDAPSPDGAAADGSHTFFALRCSGGIAVVSTTREAIYAETDCATVPPDAPLLSKAVQLRLEPGPSMMTIRSENVSYSLQAARVWLETH